MKWLLQDKIFVLESFLSPEECAAQTALTEGKGYTPAGLTVGPDQYVAAPEIRNNDRVIRDDPLLARQLWPRVKDFVANLDGWRPVSLNERFRYYRYGPGQRFAPHYDGRFTRNEEEHSKLTFMVYLNDDFEGGETIFNRDNLSVKPRTGMALVFVHAILHEGSSVTKGLKYVLRTDVMYRAPVDC